MGLVRLYSADDAIEAHLLRHMLEQQGMQAFITGEHLESAIGELPAGGLIDVWVVEEHLEDAQDVLEDFFDSMDEPLDDDDELIGANGYYADDIEPEDEAPAPGPAHDSPENPWNGVYRKK